MEILLVLSYNELCLPMPRSWAVYFETVIRGGQGAMPAAKKRYKAVINNRTYTIIGRESSQHMDMVTKLVNDQLKEIKGLSASINAEDGAILVAINAISDQLKKQEELLKLQKKNRELKEQAQKVNELSNRLKRIEAIEAEAKQVLEQTGRGDVEISNHLEAQQILNEHRKQEIKGRTPQE